MSLICTLHLKLKKQHTLNQGSTKIKLDTNKKILKAYSFDNFSNTALHLPSEA